MNEKVQKEAVDKELERNIKAYQEMKGELCDKYPGMVALFSNGQFIEAYNDNIDAYKVWCERFWPR